MVRTTRSLHHDFWRGSAPEPARRLTGTVWVLSALSEVLVGEQSMSPLVVLLHDALSWISPEGRAVVDAVAAAGGVAEGAHFLARRLALPSRHALARIL